jgi:hypothetical protein
MQLAGVSLIERSQPKGDEPTMRGRELKSDVNLRDVKAKGVKQVGCKVRATCVWFFTA